MGTIRLGFFFFFQAEDGIRDHCVTGVQTCALPIYAVVFVVYLGHYWQLGLVLRTASLFVSLLTSILYHEMSCEIQSNE